MNRSKFFRDLTWLVVIIVLFGLTFFLNFYLSYEVSLFPLYMLGIGLASWKFGRIGAASFVLIATGLWLVGAYHSGDTFSSPRIIYINAFSRFVAFVWVAIFVLILKGLLREQEKLNQSLRGLMNVCQRCGAIQGSDGKWFNLGEDLPETQHRVCFCVKCQQSQK